MALSSQSYVWTTGPKTFAITDFTLQREKYLSVARNGSTAGVVWTLSGTMVTVTSTVNVNDVILITRTTDLENSNFLVAFTDPSTLRAEDLTTATQQLLHICQELSEGAIEGTFMGKTSGGGSWNAEGLRLLSGPTDHTSIVLDEEFTTKEYVDSVVVAAGNLPDPTVESIGETLVIKDDGGSNAWKVRSSWTQTSVYQVVGAGDAAAETLWLAAGGAAYVGGYAPTSSSDGEMLVLPDVNPNDDNWDSATHTAGPTPAYTATQKAMEFEEVFFNRSQSLRSGGGQGISLGGDKKTFTIFSTSTGWKMKLNVLVFAKKNQSRTPWSEDFSPAIRFAIWDTTGTPDKVLDAADDFVFNGATALAGSEGSKPDVTGGVSTRRGRLEFPRSRYMEIGNLTWDNPNSVWSRSVAFKNDETFVFEYTWETHLPVSAGAMTFQILVQAADFASRPDWSFIARPSTVTFETGNGVNMLPL